MKMKLGILLDNLGPNQLAFNVIKNGNEVKDFDFIAFYENFLRPCIPPNFAIMQSFEAWSYDGALVATNLSTAGKLISYPICKHKYFYVWDLEWIRLKEKHYGGLQPIYNHPKLKVIARSQSHKDIIENCWNVKVAGIVDDCNISKIQEIIHG